MRDAINFDERDRLVRAVRAGHAWDEVRGMLRGVDPVALDRGWKDAVLRLAGVEEPAPAPAVPENMARMVEANAPRPQARKKG
jgi:hypothetical protein